MVPVGFYPQQTLEWFLPKNHCQRYLFKIFVIDYFCEGIFKCEIFLHWRKHLLNIPNLSEFVVWTWVRESVGWILRVMNSVPSSITNWSCSGLRTWCITRIERPKRKMPLRRKKGTDPLAIRLKDEISRSEQPLPLNEGVNDDPCHYHLQRHKSSRIAKKFWKNWNLSKTPKGLNEGQNLPRKESNICGFSGSGSGKTARTFEEPKIQIWNFSKSQTETIYIFWGTKNFEFYILLGVKNWNWTFFEESQICKLKWSPFRPHQLWRSAPKELNHQYHHQQQHH